MQCAIACAKTQSLHFTYYLSMLERWGRDSFGCTLSFLKAGCMPTRMSSKKIQKALKVKLSLCIILGPSWLLATRKDQGRKNF